MAIVLAISPLFASCRPTSGKPNNVMACKPVIKSVSVSPKPITRRSGNVMACKSVVKSSSRATNVSVSPEPITRRSGNYKPCLWDDNFLQSMKSDYTGESIKARASELKEEVRLMFSNLVEPLDQLELIDDLQKLGLAYHFQEEINCTLKMIHNGQINDDNRVKDLHATALEFRLLRQHGFYTSPEGFKRFTGNDRFRKGIRTNIKGLLSLYEASYFSIEGESLMEEAWSFTTKSLKECLENIVDLDLQMQVRQALELPLQWRIPRFDARWYIDLYQRSRNMIPAVLEFAKLDFNIMQAFNQEELKDMSRWWSRLGLGEKLPFARDRLVASFFWSLGIVGDRKDGYCLEQCTKIIELIGVYDDVYDVYGTLDELELFTDVVERWDINAMKELPDYMKLCLLSLYNFVHETTYHILMEQNIDVLHHQRKWWMDLLLKRYLVEARWYHGGYQATFEEHMRNGFVSSAGPIVGLYSYICSANPVKEEVMDFIEELPDIVRLAFEIFRLSDDYGTGSAESKRGDVPSTIHCYMSDTGVSEEIAREHMMDLMRKKWAQVNKCRFSEDVSPLSWDVVDLLLNLVRVSHWLYNAGDDGFGAEDVVAESTLFSLVVQPIPL
ncbi:(+)-delta-cadinene synthase [Heracleum sosnowskyi]|uniref:(+)-delta-cadinene synthase n=1 Tax=Heracleum sosnowskyi TaxID=360622 RepID=A0AAD8MAN0_9APIA|nr:(+)-delta-cadinene synthase [Heracleum sosnowskyi]